MLFTVIPIPRMMSPKEIVLPVKMDCNESGMSGCSQESGKAQSNVLCLYSAFLKVSFLLPGCWGSILCSAPPWGQGCSLCFSRQMSMSPFRSQGSSGDRPRLCSVPRGAGAHPGCNFSARGWALSPAALALPGDFPAMLET